jgi:signal transduction histidine kinase
MQFGPWEWLLGSYVDGYGIESTRVKILSLFEIVIMLQIVVFVEIIVVIIVTGRNLSVDHVKFVGYNIKDLHRRHVCYFWLIKFHT